MAASGSGSSSHSALYVCMAESAEYSECVSLVLHQLRGFAGDRFFMQPPHVTILERIAHGKYGDIHLASTGALHPGDCDVRASVPVVVREYHLPKLSRTPMHSIANRQSSASAAIAARKLSTNTAHPSSPSRQHHDAANMQSVLCASDALAIVHRIVREIRMWLTLTSSADSGSGDSESAAQSEKERGMCLVSLFGVCYDSKEERILAYTEWCEFGDLHAIIQPVLMTNLTERDTKQITADKQLELPIVPVISAHPSNASQSQKTRCPNNISCGVHSANSNEANMYSSAVARPQRLSLQLASTVLVQLLRSVHNLHSHRKAAVGNIRLDHMLLGNDELCLIKLSDLSAAEFVHHSLLDAQGEVDNHASNLPLLRANKKSAESTLRMLYASPELYYGETCNAFANDIWALGICFFVLLTGTFPYPCPSVDDSRLRCLVNGKVNEVFRQCCCPADLKDNMQLMDFLQNIFTQPQHRWSAEQLLRHPFITQQAAKFESSIRKKCERANNSVMQVFQKHIHNADSPTSHNMSPEALSPDKQPPRTIHSHVTPKMSVLPAASALTVAEPLTTLSLRHPPATGEELLGSSSAGTVPLHAMNWHGGGVIKSAATSPSPFSFPLPLPLPMSVSVALPVPASSSTIPSARQRSITDADDGASAAVAGLAYSTALISRSEFTEPAVSPFASFLRSARVSASPLLHAQDLDDEIAFYNQNHPFGLSPPHSHQTFSQSNTPQVNALAVALSASASAIASPAAAAASPAASILASSSVSACSHSHFSLPTPATFEPNSHSTTKTAARQNIVGNMLSAAGADGQNYPHHEQCHEQNMRSPIPNSLPATAGTSTAASIAESLSVVGIGTNSVSSHLSFVAPVTGASHQQTSHSRCDSGTNSNAAVHGTHTQHSTPNHSHSHSNVTNMTTANAHGVAMTSHNHISQPPQQLLGARLLKPSSAPPHSSSILLMAVTDESDPFLPSPSQSRPLEHDNRNQSHAQRLQVQSQLQVQANTAHNRHNQNQQHNHHLRAESMSDHTNNELTARSSSAQPLLSLWSNTNPIALTTQRPRERQRSLTAATEPPIPISLTVLDVRVAAVN